MNPFHFVPFPLDGPRPLTSAALNGPRLEGYLKYSLKTLTPLHITGKTSRESKHFKEKTFYARCGRRVIPGSSLRGMISSCVEALTGSDLRSFTRGNETGSSDRPVYGKWYDSHNSQKCRHVGFLVASTDQDDHRETKKETYDYPYHGRKETRQRFERNETLPSGFGRHMVEDAATFFFGFVDQENGDEAAARPGRVVFEDLAVPGDINLGIRKAWDLDSDAVMGSPNPRANTAWYFTPGAYRIRKVHGGPKVWEVLADKLRGRKFYFHQYPEDCHEKYRRWKEWMPLVEYDVEAIDGGCKITNGRIYFTDLPEPMLKLLVYSLTLDRSMAHKLGALKPFGFGSVKIRVESLLCKDMGNPFGALEPKELSANLVEGLIDKRAFRLLKKIMHFPSTAKKENYVFLYPPFRPGKGVSDREKGFACVEIVRDTRQSARPKPGSSKKITMFFDHYQKKAVNYDAVMK